MSNVRSRNVAYTLGTICILVGIAYNIYSWLTTNRLEYEILFVGVLLIMFGNTMKMENRQKTQNELD